MNNIRDSVSNLKTSLLKFLILFVMMLSCSFLFTGITTYAAEGTGDSSGGGTGSGTYSGGYSDAKSGWLVYTVNQQGYVTSPSIWFLSTSMNPPSGSNVKDYVLTRTTGQPATQFQIGYPWDPPIEGKVGKGAAVKQWMLSKDENGYENWQSVIMDLWNDPDFARKFVAEENALILEPIFWHNVYKGYTKTSTILIGSANTIARYQLGVPELNPNGSPVLRLYDNNRIPHSARFEQSKTIMGLKVPSQTSGTLTNQQIADEAYGILAIWPNTSSIHTYDGVNSPGKSPLTPAGFANIVKSYHTLNETTGEDIDDGCYITTNVSNNIIIDDEDEYKVEKWVVTDSDPTEVPGNSWNPPGTVQDSGNSSGSTTVKDPGKTLFVLLKKTEQEEEEEIPEGIDYVIEQSQITKQVLLSEAQTNPDAKNIKTYEFKWNLPSLKNSCPGHSYPSGTRDVYDDEGNKVGEETVYSNAYCGNWQITDKTITVGLKNDLYLDYPEILADSNAWRKLPAIGEQTTQTYDRGNNFGSHDKGYTNWDYKMVIHRGNDKLTLAEWKGLGLEVAEV